LHYAVELGKDDVCKNLLKWGANPEIIGKGIVSPTFLALKQGRRAFISDIQDLRLPTSSSYVCQNDPISFVVYDNLLWNTELNNDFFLDDRAVRFKSGLMEFAGVHDLLGIREYYSIQEILVRRALSDDFIALLRQQIQLKLDFGEVSEITLEAFKMNLIHRMTFSQKVFAATRKITYHVGLPDGGEIALLSYNVQALSPFVHPLLFHTANGVVLSGRGEYALHANLLEFLFRQLGVPVLSRTPSYMSISEGDYIPAGEDMCFVGVGIHTDEAAVRWMMRKNHFGHGTVIVVRDLFDRNELYPHLSDCLKVVDKNTILVFSSLLGKDNPSRRLVDEYTQLPSGEYVCTQHGAELGDFLEKYLGFQLIRCPPEFFQPGFGVFNAGEGKLYTADEKMADLLSTVQNLSVQVISAPFCLDLLRYSFLFRKSSITSFVKRQFPELPPGFLSYLPMEGPKRQTTNTILMVAPVGFQTNEETLKDNYFMQRSNKGGSEIEMAALREYSVLYARLTAAGVRVVLFSSDHFQKTPDAVFPNNWFSTHPASEVGKSTVAFYPMKTESRRQERRQYIISLLQERYEREMSFTHWEAGDVPQFFESTGVLILDRVHRIAYAALSQRCSKSVAKEWGKRMGYDMCLFHVSDSKVWCRFWLSSDCTSD
jgi:N-dimethylarginine dimethylaminohydrolase